MNVLIVITFILTLLSLAGVCFNFYYLGLLEQKLLEQFTTAYNLEAKFKRIVKDYEHLS